MPPVILSELIAPIQLQAACHWIAPFPPLIFINRASRVRFMILLSCLALLWTLVWLQVNTVNIRTVVMVL